MLTAVEGIYENGAIRLLEPLPGVSWARVVVMILPDQEKMVDENFALAKTDKIALEENQGQKDFKPQTELGKRLWEIRQRAIAKGMQLLSWDEVKWEQVQTLQRRVTHAAGAAKTAFPRWSVGTRCKCENEKL